ncbi:kinesin-like protein KIF26B isoform X1 [Cololabis saira]|uniref:kinesin-like protein KIF26B isoform X1 n=1 Tax=Cololabis saira TaxID=129043 RepID=UPI002AD37DD5|nr:kinesin-like protein KIF26B isoform X1 [Cololabis saira]
MSAVRGRGERFPASVRGAHLGSEVQHHCCEPGGFCAPGRERHPRERPAPEGAGGSAGDPTMCQRGDDAPSSPYRSLHASVGERIRSSMLFGSRTVCRGSSPGSGGSDRKAGCCEKCSATLVALKKQALSLAVHHHFSCKEPSDLAGFLHDNLRVQGRSNSESRERDRELGQCGACGANMSHLKQEAIHLALSRGQALARPPHEAGLGAGAVHQPRSQTYAPPSPRTPQRTPQTLRRRGAKLPNPDMDRWVEEQQQLLAYKSASNTDGAAMNLYNQAADEATLICGDTGTVQTSSRIPHISRVVTIANTAAMSLLARAAEKLNLTLRKKGQASDPAPSHLSTCFRELVQKNPPPVPPCLLQAATRTKDMPDVAKVKVVLRVSRMLADGQGQPPVLRIDPSRRRVTVLEPVSRNLPYTSMTLGRSGKSPLKTFNVDAAYSQDSSQAELSAGVLADVIRCVLSGSDGCVLGLGSTDVGSWSSMVGSGESHQKLGLIPCAISWLYSAIERRREKTWTDLSVSVSAVELCCGEEDTLRDLLGEVVLSSGGVQDSPKAHVRIQDDPVYGLQLRNHNRVKAPTAERAASLLDAAIAARRHADFITYLCDSSIMFFTLYVQPPRTESSTIGKGSRSITKLTMIDVCSGMRGVSKNKPPHSDLGPIVLSLLSGHKTTPSKNSKLTMLLRDSLAHANCHITVVAQVADSPAHLQETFSTIQLASRIRRTQKRTKQSTSCSPRGRSLTKDKKGAQSLSLRAFHSTDEVDADIRPFRLRGELERSSSDQSCDTVIQIDSDGLVHSKAATALVQPEFVPIIPSLHPNKADLDDPEFTALLQELLRIPKLHGGKKMEEGVQRDIEILTAERKQPERECLKCDTFAELQERLGCIDGSELTMDMIKSSLQGASLKNIMTKSLPRKEASSAPQSLLTRGLGCNQTSVGEKQTDGALPGDSFQREDSGLYDCEECSATSSSEELLNQNTCRSDPPTSGAVKSVNEISSRGVDSKTQGKAAAGSPARQPSEKQESRDAADWFKPGKRASPVGKCSPMSPPSSFSPAHSLAKSVILEDVLPNRTAEEVKEMKATITVTVQQPLDLMGQDELVFSMVEEVTFSGAYDTGNTGGNIICLRDPVQSQGQGQSSTSCQPIRIISNVSDDSAAAGANSEKPLNLSRREKTVLPSFINPMLMNSDADCDLGGVKGKESLENVSVKCPGNTKVHENVSKTQGIKTMSLVVEEKAFGIKPAEDRMCEKRQQNTGKSHPRDCKHVCTTNDQRASEGGGIACRHVGSLPKRTGVSPGCHEIILDPSETGSLPRVWQNPNHRGNSARGVTSSTPCSPGGTLERGKGRQHIPSPQKHGREFKQAFSETSSLTRKANGSSGRHKSPTEDSGRLFSCKLEQLASRNNSLGRNPRDSPTLERSGSKGYSDEAWKGGHKGSYEGDFTFPRASRSPRKTPRYDQGHHFFHPETLPPQSAKNSHTKLLAVGKLKIGSPKVRRTSSPSMKNLQHPLNRSASLSPDSKAVSFERMSSFCSSSPPRSYRSISRTPSQSSTCSSTKSVIQGFVNGRISDLLKETAPSPDHTVLLPSPYSQVTAPRSPDHLGGHASDTTSVLSGDLPPAMGKTSLHFSNRSSFVSSGYGSMMRDSEAAGSSTSNRDSVSDRSGSLLSEARSSRSSRRHGNTGTPQRRLSHDAPPALKRSASGLRSRWTDRGIPESYEIKVYEIDNAQRMQKRAGPRMLQRQAEVSGAPSAEDLRGAAPIQQPEERFGGGQAQPHAGRHQVEPRI